MFSRNFGGISCAVASRSPLHLPRGRRGGQLEQRAECVVDLCGDSHGATASRRNASCAAFACCAIASGNAVKPWQPSSYTRSSARLPAASQRAAMKSESSSSGSAVPIGEERRRHVRAGRRRAARCPDRATRRCRSRAGSSAPNHVMELGEHELPVAEGRRLGVPERSNTPKTRFAAANAPLIPCRSRRRSSVDGGEVAAADSPPTAYRAGTPSSAGPCSSSQSAASSQSSCAAGYGCFRREAVLDADGAEAGGLGDRLQTEVLLVGRADHPAAAVEVEIRALRLARRRDHAKAECAAARRNLEPVRVRQELRRGQHACPVLALRAQLGGRNGLARRLRRLERLDLKVQRTRLVDGVEAEDHASRRNSICAAFASPATASGNALKTWQPSA